LFKCLTFLAIEPPSISDSDGYCSTVSYHVQHSLSCYHSVTLATEGFTA